MPWRKFPSLAGDPRLELLPDAGCVVLLHAWAKADDEGRLPAAGAVPPFDALALVLARVLPEGRARAGIADCIRLGFLSEDARLLDWIGPTAPPPTEPDPTAEADDAAAPEAPRTAPRRPGRPPKGAAAMTPTERKQKARFELREGSFRDVPAGMTWEAWRSQGSVTKLPADNVTKLDEVGHETPDDVTKLRHETPSRNSVGGRAVSETSSPSGASEDQNRAEEKRNPDAPAASRNSVTKLRHETPGAVTEPRHETPSASCPTVETLSAVDGNDLMARLAPAVLVGGRARIFLRGGPQTEQAFVGLVRALVARGHATVDQVVAAVAFGARAEWVAKARRPVDLGRVLEEDGKLLVEWLNRVDREPAAASPAPAATRALAVDKPALSRTEAAAALARMKASTKTQSTTDTAAPAAEGATDHG